jgi:hypothetical protein
MKENTRLTDTTIRPIPDRARQESNASKELAKMKQKAG